MFCFESLLMKIFTVHHDRLTSASILIFDRNFIEVQTKCFYASQRTSFYCSCTKFNK